MTDHGGDHGDDPVEHDDGEIIDLREELWLIRRELDRLANARLIHFLSPDEEERYQVLARREVELIGALATQGPVTDLTDSAWADWPPLEAP